MELQSLDRAVEAVRRLLCAEACLLLSPKDEDRSYRLVAASGLRPEDGERLVELVSSGSGLGQASTSWSLHPLRNGRSHSEWQLLTSPGQVLPEAVDDPLRAVVLGYLAAVVESYESGVVARRGYESIIEIGSQIQADVGLDSVLKFIVEQARSLLGTELSWLGLIDDSGKWLRIKVASGNRTAAFARMAVPVTVGVGGQALTLRRTLVVEDYPHLVHRTTTAARRAVLAEGVVSLVCAPLLRGTKALGVLYVGARKPSRFSAGDASLLTTLATQASIAIDNARLVGDLKRALEESNRLNALLEAKNRVLEHSETIHRQLTDAMLAGARADQLGDVLAQLVGRQLVIRQSICPPFVSTHFPRHCKDSTHNSKSPAHLDSREQEGSPDRSEAIEVPILAGRVHLGEIVVAGSSRPLGDLRRRALEHGATVLALELLKQREIQGIEERLQGDLLSALLEGAGPPPSALAQRALRFGFDVSQPHYIVVLETAAVSSDSGLDPWHPSSLLKRISGPKVLALARGGRIILAVRALEESAIRQIAEKMLNGLPEPAWAGVSGATGPDRDYRQAYSEALACLRLARACRDTGTAPKRVVTYQQLGAMRFLLDANGLDHARQVIDEWLGPLIAYDRSRRSQLLRTLRAYVEADGHYPTVASRCFIHVSTLKYRLGVIRKVLGRPLSDPELRFGLWVAFRLMDILEARTEEMATALPADTHVPAEVPMPRHR